MRPEPRRAELAGAIRPDWPAPPSVLALMSGRQGGVSRGPFDSLNLRPPELGGEAMDAADAVHENQRRFAAALGARPVWLHQVHGTRVLHLSAGWRADQAAGAALPCADAAVSTEPGIAATVLVADCLPVLLCSADGRAVAAAHAGWRGLAAGVIDHTVAALCEAAGCGPADLLAWLGPCIGPSAFEVGPDVLQAFGADPAADAPPCFRPSPRADGSARWRADLPALARRRLAALGVRRVSGGGWCTVEQRSRFFSFRRDGQRSGRMAAAISLVGG